MAQRGKGTGEVRLVYCLSIDLIESTLPGLRMTQVELDRFNRALVSQIEPHLEALLFEDLLVKFTGDGWLLMTPEVRDAERLCALAVIMRGTFADEMNRRTGLPLARIPDLRMAICTGRDIRISVWHGAFDWVGDSARRSTRSARFCYPNEVVIDSSVHSLVMRDFVTARIDPASRPTRTSIRGEEEIPLWSLDDLRIEAVEDWDAAAAYVYALSRTGRLDDAAEASLRAASRLGEEVDLSDSPSSVRTVHRWNRLIANAPSFESIEELMTRMLESPTRPDQGTLVALVDRAPTFEEAQRWVADMDLHGVTPDALVYTTLIRRAPTFDVALELVDEVEDGALAPNVDMLHALISKAPSFKRALALLSSFGDRGVEPNVGVFGRLMARAPGYDAAVGMLDVMRSWSVAADTELMNRLITLAPDPDTATGWLETMVEWGIEPDVETFNILIARASRYGVAMDLLTKMREQSVAPDVTTFNTLMARAPDHELAVSLLRHMEESDVHPNSETFKTLITRSPDYPTAVGWLAEMRRRGVRPNNEVFKALIGRAPDFSTATAWLHEMPNAHVGPNAETFRTLIARAPDFESGADLVAEMDRRGVITNEETFKTLASLATNEPARSRFLELLAAAGLRPTADVIHPLIARAQDLDGGLPWLERMAVLRVDPNAETLTTLLQKAGGYSHAVDLFDRLSPSVEPNEGAYKVLVDRAPDFQTALEWVERMRVEGMRPEVGVLTMLLGKEPGEWDGDALLNWYLALDHHPSGPMMTAIETHRLAGRTVDALRLALDYPHVQPARDLFRLHPSETIAYLSDVLDAEPGHPNGQYAMGLALLDLGRVDEAVGHLELAKELARPGPRIAAIEEIIRSALPLER